MTCYDVQLDGRSFHAGIDKSKALAIHGIIAAVLCTRGLDGVVTLDQEGIRLLREEYKSGERVESGSDR
jgi:hypothetical protein